MFACVMQAARQKMKKIEPMAKPLLDIGIDFGGEPLQLAMQP